MTRRDGKFWGWRRSWVGGGDGINHLWHVGVSGLFFPECPDTPLERIVIQPPVCTLADGRPPAAERCAECARIDQRQKKKRTDPTY